MFLVIIGGIYVFQGNYLVDSVIELDVNPSIELKVNKKDKIIDCIALNAIIGSMVTNGYLNDLSNSILISVDNNNSEKAEKLRQKLAAKIDLILSNDEIKGSVLSQTIKPEKTEAQEFADKYKISLGKAELILDVVKNNKLLKAENLVDLSINEINVLTQGKEESLSNVEKQGTASTKAYIGEDNAKEIALNHAKVTNPQNLKVELDREDNEYSVEFRYNGYEYDYEINATTGKIISSEKEIDND